MARLCAAGIIAASLLGAYGQGPSVRRAIPLAISPTQPTLLRFQGEHLSHVTDVWTSFPSKIEIVPPTEPGTKPAAAIFQLTGPSPVLPALGALRVATMSGVSELVVVLLDSMLAIEAAGTNHSLANAQFLPWPCAVDGVVAETSANYYRFKLKKAQRLNLEVIAARLGSTLDPVLRLQDAKGHALAHNEDAPMMEPDARIDFVAPKTGDYFLEVRDTRHQGGANFFYRLRVGQFPAARLPFLIATNADWPLHSVLAMAPVSETEPNDALEHANPVALSCLISGSFAKPRDQDWFEFQVEKDQKVVITGKTRSLGSSCDLYLQLRKADGTALLEANATSGDEGSLTNKFGETGTYRLLVEELNHRGNSNLTYRLEIAPFVPGFALSVEPSRIEAAPGDAFELKVTAARREFDGPITLALSGAPQLFAITNNVILAKSNSVQLRVTVPRELRPGTQENFAVLGRAMINDVEITTQASTLLSLKKAFPALLRPPLELDGMITLGTIKPAASNAPARNAER